ncbi:MAG: hypothetical protein KAZ48_07330 [Candidatus Nanopelagicales bacterium]|nr:hypothetical protein [Candidatus Nanopelagicales bacterium]
MAFTLTGHQIPWLIRGVIAGFAGTAAMSAIYAIKHAQRPGALGIPEVKGINGSVGFDYDDTGVPGHIIANILHLPSVSDRGAGDITLALRWSYGSAFGIAHVLLRSRMSEPKPTMLFGGALMTMTLTMFPVLGRTPPPWKWSGEVVATCVETHLAYIVTAAVADDAMRRRNKVLGIASTAALAATASEALEGAVGMQPKVP